MSTFVASDRVDDWVTVSYEHHVSVSLISGHIILASATADQIPINGVESWWIGRVFVRPWVRRKGFGRQAVNKLVSLAQASNPVRVVVSPGGYGSDMGMLDKFYRTCGFAEVDTGLYELVAA